MLTVITDVLVLRTSCKKKGYNSFIQRDPFKGSLFLSKYKIGDLLSTMFCKTKMSREERQKWKLKMYNRWEDTLEVRLAGIKAAKAKLEEQMNRDEN